VSLSIRCKNPDCPNLLKVTDESSGKRIKCPACGQLMSVPAQGSASKPAGDGTKPHGATSRPQRRLKARHVALFALVLLLLYAALMIYLLSTGVLSLAGGG
jgi:ribosomal protein S27E